MKKRIVYCGVSHRAIRLHIETPPECWAGWELAGLWDVDPLRVDEFRRMFPLQRDVPGYLGADAYERMLDEVRPDRVFVCTRDAYHADYAVRALRRGIDVIVEKPMVTTGEQCRRLREAERAGRARVTVAFNFRFAPKHRRIRQLVADGAVGTVTAVEMNTYLDEVHGASYFQRWNRRRAESGGLTIHKAGHHLDLVNWWIGQTPVELFGYAGLKYYGPDAELNPSRRDGRHCGDCGETDRCAYRKYRLGRASVEAHIRELQGAVARLGARDHNTAKYSGYRPDQCIFDREIDIEDTYAAVARYDGGAFLSFSVNFSSPFEAYRLVINGTRGRIEAGYGFPPGDGQAASAAALVYTPLFSGAAQVLPVEVPPGGHGGGDPAMLRALYGCAPELEPVLADSWDGAKAVGLGEALWRSPRERRAIPIAEIVGAAGA